MRDTNKKLGIILICFASMYTAQAFAINITAVPVQDVVTFLKDTIIQNLAYVAAFCAFIIAAIAAVGNKIGPVISDNIGKLLYFAFGGTILTYLLSAAGATLS